MDRYHAPRLLPQVLAEAKNATRHNRKQVQVLAGRGFIAHDESLNSKNDQQEGGPREREIAPARDSRANEYEGWTTMASSTGDNGEATKFCA